jgi:OmpA-OmpF porin, OOP family
MRVKTTKPASLILLGLLALPVSFGASAQSQETTGSNITVTGDRLPDTSAMTKGPEVKGIIVARGSDRVRVRTADGESKVVFFNETTRIRTGGLFGGSRNRLGAAGLLNGLPITAKTMDAGGVLLASQISYSNRDHKFASMIRNGTEQGFAEQSAATQALRGRMADIDQYNVKGTTNVYFDTGKAQLSEQAQAELCNTASQAENTNNALMLVVGYTDSVGSQEYNQTLSERRAARVINYLQQACRWKPYRMLTPTGMAESDPVADNETPQGKAQNRRVSVNILVSKAVDGM